MKITNSDSPLIISLLFISQISLGYSVADFPFQHAWRIKNNTKQPITFNVIYKSRYPGFGNVDEVPFDRNAIQLDAGKEKLIELEPTTNIGLISYPARIEVFSAKNKATWAAPKPGSYNININSKDNTLSIDTTPWTPQEIEKDQQGFIKKFKDKIDYYFKTLKPEIDKFLARKAK